MHLDNKNTNIGRSGVGEERRYQRPHEDGEASAGLFEITMDRTFLANL